MIREAERRDRARIEELYKILIPDDDEIKVLDERIDQIKQDPNHYLLVYENDGTVVGTILLCFFPDAMYGNRPYAMLENLIIDPVCRGLGVGKQLFEHIEVLCKAEDCREILLMSNVIRTGAHQFFERLGYAHVAKGFKKYI